MAINVDTVYKTVLLILNKEQRGYLTPNEFNKIATQVQLEIFERYFEDLNQQLRIPGKDANDSEYANRVKSADEKLSVFKRVSGGLTKTGDYFELPSGAATTYFHKLGTVIYKDIKEAQKIQRNEYLLINKSPLTKPTTEYPVYMLEEDKIYVYPSSITAPDITVSYIKKPHDVVWGYTLGSLGQYIHDGGASETSTLDPLYDLTLSITTQPTAVGLFPTLTNPVTYTGTIGTTPGYTTNGDGTGATINIIMAGGVATSVVVHYLNVGSGFRAGDTITVSSPTLGMNGLDLVITLTSAALAPISTGITSGSYNFDLDPSEQTEVILNILMYAGVVIRDPQVVQVAATKVKQEEVNEKS
ncbi:hypothetical protein CMI37_18150 [Candidatus Pacearchaeota archaeon]|nr:hypothetical protein [Candidatus Pacearchaeota archaeon]|tara:strand:+ start:981 stop:2054 length:1074 start_codon:yes stop_codon:yes gene_type:complete